MPATAVLNLIDTPGHTDFGYEVTRSLAACEGAAARGHGRRGGQTLANAYLADNNLRSVPVINKIDLPSAARRVQAPDRDIIGLDSAGAILASAKEGTGVRETRRMSHAFIRQPVNATRRSRPDLRLWFDPRRGVVIVIRVIDGVIGRR